MTLKNKAIKCLRCGDIWQVKTKKDTSSKYPYCEKTKCQNGRREAARIRQNQASQRWRDKHRGKIQKPRTAKVTEDTGRKCRKCQSPILKYTDQDGLVIHENWRLCKDCRVKEKRNRCLTGDDYAFNICPEGVRKWYGEIGQYL